MKRLLHLVALTILWSGCDTLTGPNESYIVPAVDGRVVDAVSGLPLQDARIQRYLHQPKPSEALAKKGAERLQSVPTLRSDAEGRFQIAPEKGGYLLFSQPGLFEFTLIVRHSTHETLTTNIDLLKIKPVKTNRVLTVFVGDLPLEPKDR